MYNYLCSIVISFLLVFQLHALQAPAQHAKNIYVVNSQEDSVTVLNGVTTEIVATIPVGKQPSSIAITEDGLISHAKILHRLKSVNHSNGITS